MAPEKEKDFNCERCGDCCRSYSLWLGKPYNGDLARLMTYHKCVPVRRSEGQGGMEDEMGIRIPSKCVHLVTEDGKTSCRIYEDRPDVCRRYFCKKVMDKTVAELVTDGVHV